MSSKRRGPCELTHCGESAVVGQALEPAGSREGLPHTRFLFLGDLNILRGTGVPTH